ncbi:hypothetical protein TNCV_986991 [Trichonephila clavipes]|nr:hypothetical protein TNCV_986991 [Trichonephila clavipes]
MPPACIVKEQIAAVDRPARGYSGTNHNGRQTCIDNVVASGSVLLSGKNEYGGLVCLSSMNACRTCMVKRSCQMVGHWCCMCNEERQNLEDEGRKAVA